MLEPCAVKIASTVLRRESSSTATLLSDDFIHPQTAKRIPGPFDVRQETEIKMLDHALKYQLPVLGICGGMQLINCALGGSLEQHLPDDKRVKIAKINHYDKKHLDSINEQQLKKFEINFPLIVSNKIKNNIYNSSHSMRIDKNSDLGEIYLAAGHKDLDNIFELSIHHQGCFTENLSDRLYPVAFSDDGLIEAAILKNSKKMFLLTQFHPECNLAGAALPLVRSLLASC